MVETESILNSRPLTNVAEQPEHEEPLTPNHFPIQRPFNSLPPGQFGDQQPASLKTWKNTQKLMNHIWRRLVKEYLPTLSRRSKWSNSNDRPLKVDDVVWVLKDQTPRAIWPLGKVMETTPGRDGETRVKVKTAYGTFVRPVSGLARVFSPYFFSIFLAPFLGNVSYPFPTNWCTDHIDNISAYSFRANFKEDDKRLQSIDASENPWCPLCSLAACCRCYCNFQDDSKTAKIATKTWLFCPTTWNLDVLF